MKTVDDVKREFATEIKDMHEKSIEEGKALASGIPPEAATGERLAERAREIQAAQPGLSNLEATKRAYAEAGVPMK